MVRRFTQQAVELLGVLGVHQHVHGDPFAGSASARQTSRLPNARPPAVARCTAQLIAQHAASMTSICSSSACRSTRQLVEHGIGEGHEVTEHAPGSAQFVRPLQRRGIAGIARHCGGHCDQTGKSTGRCRTAAGSTAAAGPGAERVSSSARNCPLLVVGPMFLVLSLMLATVAGGSPGRAPTCRRTAGCACS